MNKPRACTVRHNKHSLRAQKQPVYPNPSQTEDNNADRQRENKPVAKIDQLAFWVKSAKVIIPFNAKI